MNTEETQQQEFHLRDYWQVLVRRRWIVYTCVLVTTIAAAVASLVMTPVYQAKAQLSIERTGVRLLRQNLTSAEPSWIDYQNFYNTQYQIIASRAVVAKAVGVLDLPNREIFEDEEVNPFVERVREIKREAVRFVSRAPELEPRSDGSLEPYIEALRGMIGVVPVRDSHLVDVLAVHQDPAFAAEAANAVCEAYKMFTLEAKLELAKDSEEFFAARIKELRDELRMIEDDLAEFAMTHNIVAGSEETVAREDLIDVRRKLAEARTRVADKEAVLESLQRTPPASIREVRDSTTIQALTEAINSKEREYSSQSARLGENFPSVQQIKADLEESRRRLEKETARLAKQVVDTARSDLREARNREANLSSLFEKQRTEIDQQQEHLTEYETLRTLVQRKRDTLNDLLVRQNDMQISASLGDANHNVRLIERAVTPRIIHRPKKKLNIVLGFLFGLFLGVGASILMEYIDNTLKTPEDVRKVLNHNVLGLIPAHDPGTMSRSKRDRKGASRGPTDPALITARTPMSPIAEAYRELRTALLLTTPGHPPRDIAVSSCQPSEGKTTTAINLATALTQLGKRVLIIDTDLRRPRCHQVLKVTASRGVSNYLSGLSDLEGLVQDTPIDKLSVLPAGPIPPNPAELLDSSRFLEFLRDLRRLESYDHIIFDTPPILSVVDPLLTARHTEGLILVIRSAFTSREAGRLGIEKLRSGRVNLLGIVLNAVESDHVPYQYRYYRYGYSQEQRKRKEASRGKDVAAS